MNDPVEAPEATARGYRRFELLCGVTLTIFAAIIALCDLSAGRFNSDALIANNEKASGYTWYQSKSVKGTLAEGQRDGGLVVCGVAGTVVSVIAYQSANAA